MIAPDSPGSPRIDETLTALQARVRRLLFIKHTNADAGANITRLARQLNVYLNGFVQTLQARTTTGKTQPRGKRPSGPPAPDPMRFLTDGGQLLAALDAYLKDPTAAPVSAALAETVTRICGTPPPTFSPPSPLAAPAAPNPARAPNDHRAPFMPPRYPTAAPLGWQHELGALRRRTSLAMLLAGLAFIGMAALLVAPSDRLTPPLDQQERQTGPIAPAEDPRGPDSRPGGPNDAAGQALRQLPERFAELDLAILRLDARLAALEAQQVTTDRARALPPGPSPSPKSPPDPEPTAPPPAVDTQTPTDHPASPRPPPAAPEHPRLRPR